MTVKELADDIGVSPDTVRHYTRIGLLTPKRDASNGYRLFFDNELRRLKFIRSARALGFTLDEVALILELGSRGESPCPNARQILRHHIAENRAKIEALSVLQARMEGALEKWNELPDKTPCDTSICHLIEQFSEISDL